MALTNSEVARIKAELGFSLLTVDAEPYISYVSLFDQIIQPYLSAGASTTSATTVEAASTATPRTLTLASATGFSSGTRVVIDVDDRQEVATIQNLSGTSMTVLLKLAHTGTYPVTVEGGESIIREILGHIRSAKVDLAKAHGRGSLKRADDIEFYQAGDLSAFSMSSAELDFWREQLASVLGIESMWSLKRGAGARVAVY